MIYVPYINNSGECYYVGEVDEFNKPCGQGEVFNPRSFYEYSVTTYKGQLHGICKQADETLISSNCNRCQRKYAWQHFHI